MVNIICEVNTIIFENPDNGYAVILGKDTTTRKCLTMVFPNGFPSPRVGLRVNANGEWVESIKYGKQFKVDNYTEEMPDSLEGAVAYLSCGIFKGIGEKFAERIVREFGKDVFNVIENTPDELYKVKGIGKKKINNLLSEWKSHQNIRKCVCFFSQYGLSINTIMKLYKKYEDDAVEMITENPYRLTDEVYGIGFKRADEIALKLGIDEHDINRICSCIQYVLTMAAEDGHTYLSKDDLIDNVTDLINVELDDITNGMNVMLLADNREIIEESNKVFLPSIYRAEHLISDKLKDLFDFKPFRNSMFDVNISDIESVVGVKYNEEQIKAINTAIDNNVMVLTGGPGTGKTTALKGLIYLLRCVFGFEIACAAPTGRAAKRMSEVTGMKATTIHRLLSYHPELGFQYNAENKLYHDVIVIDEASMINVLLMKSLLEAIKDGAKLIIVGDENQLPCIGPGNILHDIIDAGTIPVITLKEIFRQAAGSNIIMNAHNIINEKPIMINNNDPDNDFFFISENNPDKLTETITDLVTKRLPKKYGIKPVDIQVLTPRRKDARACAIELNKILQDAINPDPVSISCGSYSFRLGDKVMQIKNNYDKNVFNGDVGFIVDINVSNKSIRVDFGDDSIVPYDITDMDELVLAYACTIHKSQGSEYPIVVMPMLNSFGIMLKRNLIYTGITRAKKICVIIGEKQAVAIACKDNTYKKRNTMLKEWLME